MSRCAGLLICPICADTLTNVDRSLRCARGHAFDRAREGYVHLLPAGHGLSRLEGDARAMVRSRRRFLDQGHYRPLSDAINRAAEGLLGETLEARPATVVDAGCGEGYYLGRLGSALEGHTTAGRPCLLGIDLSKEALRYAARRHSGVEFLVNDVNHQICVADGTADLLLDIFAPRNAAEFGRVVRAGGSLIVVIPAPDHLQELRDRLPLLGIGADKRDVTVAGLSGPFTLRSEDRIRFRIRLSGPEVVDLLRMTPNYWHVDAATLEAVSEWPAREVTVSTRLVALERTGPTGSQADASGPS